MGQNRLKIHIKFWVALIEISHGAPWLIYKDFAHCTVPQGTREGYKKSSATPDLIIPWVITHQWIWCNTRHANFPRTKFVLFYISAFTLMIRLKLIWLFFFQTCSFAINRLVIAKGTSVSESLFYLNRPPVLYTVAL